MENLKIVIAGAGAGKTHSLKEEVVKCLPTLDSCRTCAVITFTNAATEELQKRLSQEVKILPNIFIGTIHSFLIQYVINPYGKLLNLISEDKIFVDGIKASWGDKSFRIQKANEWEQKGIFVYDKVFELAEKILSNNDIFNLFVNKIQFLFIDEYQDNRLKVHLLWKKVINAKQTKVYLIGDPLQCIFKFTYDLTHIQPDEVPQTFNETPLNDLKHNHSHAVSSIVENWRSRKTIVDFNNSFIKEDNYTQVSKNTNSDIPIYFIDNPKADAIINHYRCLKIEHKIHDLHIGRKTYLQKDFFEDLVLTRNWIDTSKTKTKEIYQKVQGEFSRIQKGERKVTSPLTEFSRCILAVIGLKKSDFINDIYDEIEYRKFCLEIYEEVKQSSNGRRDIIVNKFCEKFKLDVKNEIYIDQDRSLNDFFIAETNQEKELTIDSCFSTIHSAKGLEATSVLVITETNQELSDWLNFEKANTELDDKYRFGYVAFSRARDMLVIACLEQINSSNKRKLNELGILFILS